MIVFSKAGMIMTTDGRETEKSSEMEHSIWAVVSFDRVEASDLTYPEARRLLNKLESKRVAGVSIVTADAASRFGKSRLKS